MENKLISKSDLRKHFIVTQSVIIQVFGLLGNYFYNQLERDLYDILVKLENIDWRRESNCWLGRTIREDGHIMNNDKAIILTCNYIKQKLSIPLNNEEAKLEEIFIDKTKDIK
ncbi:MAG: DNA sulfur modification protein DndB [Prevotella sp.]|nr:DNA sulfur modification protein DndB [Prevotella sp.]